MTTSVNEETESKIAGERASRVWVSHLLNSVAVREVSIVFVFCIFTTILTWPYVTRLRDVVIDKGDPYLVTWMMWWDYHQTFKDPLHLFHANIFYPLKYTLAFSEHCYGIALLFFPLFALGLRPLTVHAVAMFFAFVLNGYAAFRLARTMTGSSSIAWVTGIIYAFVPYRFNMMPQLVYLFSPWIPLVFEALVLFIRKPSKKRATWLGFAFFMNGLSTISWFVLTLVPFGLFAAILLTRHDLWRERKIWLRGGSALVIAALALLPFMIPYVLVSKMYGFKRSIEEIKANSAWPSHWLAVENRNKIWNRMGEGVFEGYKFKLFPGVLPILFTLSAVILGRPHLSRTEPTQKDEVSSAKVSWLPKLDALIVLLLALSIPAVGFGPSDAYAWFFYYLSSERLLTLLTIALIIRFSIAYPTFLNAIRPNFLATLRSKERSDAFWLGLVLSVIGFCLSLGWNFFVFRICYDLLPMFRSMRVVTRSAVLAYLGLAILGGIGVKSLLEVLRKKFPMVQPKHVFVASCVLLLVEFNAAPLGIVRGESMPDAVTLRLKETSMRGGIVHLPAGGENNYRYMLRSADHEKPLVVGTSGFNSAIEDRIEGLIRTGAISDELMDLMESVPTSYLVVANQYIPPERITDYQMFMARQVAARRLRFINRFDGHDDLYAVVKTEPQAKSEAAMTLSTEVRDWSSAIEADRVVLLSQPLALCQRLYRVHVASWGGLPRYKEFQTDLEKLTRGVMVGVEGNTESFEFNLRELLSEWVKGERFQKLFGNLNDTQYVNQLIQNAGINVEPEARQLWSNALATGQESRASILLKIVDDARFIEKEKYRSLVLLHYFGYLRRNPDDPPDKNLQGFDFWVRDLEQSHTPEKLSSAFGASWEYEKYKKPETK
jgi:hypothetical protein